MLKCYYLIQMLYLTRSYFIVMKPGRIVHEGRDVAPRQADRICEQNFYFMRFRGMRFRICSVPDEKNTASFCTVEYDFMKLR